jgi:hypothetical protein
MNFLALLIVILIFATIGFLVVAITVSVLNSIFPAKRFPAKHSSPQLPPSLPVVAKPPLDPTIIKALVRKGFRVEQIEALWQSGRLTLN